MTNEKNYTNDEHLNSDNKTELANIDSVGDNIIFDKKMTPNGLENNTLYQVGNQLKPKIVNDNTVQLEETSNQKDKLILNKREIIDNKEENLEIVITNVEPTEVTKELKEKLNDEKINNEKINNIQRNNVQRNNVQRNGSCSIIFKELQEIFPLSIIISMLIFIIIFIYIVRF